MKNVREVQARLADLGYKPGPIDGIRGRRTIAAIMVFQRDKGLRPDGLVGPDTHAKLFPEAKRVAVHQSPDAAPWMGLARRKLGLHERRDNGILRRFLSLGRGTIGDPAKIPWCGDFVETCIAVALPGEPIPENPYLAANWMKFGRPAPPMAGAVLVFWRDSPKSWKGHVGFYVGEDATHYHVLGGNQRNSVSITRIEKRRLREGGVRWPRTALLNRGGRIVTDGAGLATTTNEA